MAVQRKGVQFLPSQISNSENKPPAYTSSPLKLILSDIGLVFKWSPLIPYIVLPLLPFGSGALDEQYPSWPNIVDIAVHGVLFIFQTVFLLSLPPLFFIAPVPVWAVMLYMAAFFAANQLVCSFLNGPRPHLESQVKVEFNPAHEREHWIFLNGIAVGHHWLQSNIDRLALTFGRKLIHARSGIIFDIIQCLIQRDLTYATQDVRNAYEMVRRSLTSDKYDKIVFVLHSQGGIEGGLVVDWLLDEFPQDVLSQLEVYTFGNAANHFNNPHRKMQPSPSATHANGGMTTEDTPGGGRHDKVIGHIEHYANSRDFVARWGVLNFTSLPCRYMGKVFERTGSGHELNQHYLDNMFSLNKEHTACADSNAFMDSAVDVSGDAVSRDSLTDALESVNGSRAAVLDINSPITPVLRSTDMKFAESAQDLKVKDLSRLWMYRNGMSPPA